MMPPPLATDNCLFLDVDGTLVEFTDTPSQTLADTEIKSLLSDVSERLSGALALVSGREIDTMDRLFAPLRLPAAGLHGVERRDATGVLHRSAARDGRLNGLRASLALIAVSYPGILIEDKGRNIAVHYRLAPQYGAVVRDAVADVSAPLAEDYQLQDGLMMVEIKPRGFNKGGAIEAFMREAPFMGRRPVFIGDDLTDLDGFAAVDARDGFSIAVGERVQGRYRLADVGSVRRWLREILTSRG